MKTLIINLDQSTDRLEEQKKQFENLGLSFERLAAVSIKDFTEAEYLNLAFGGQRPLKQSELACFLSHKKAWEYVIQCNQPCAILEDDAVLVKDFARILSDVSERTDIDFLNLEVHGRRKIVARQASFSSVDGQYHILKLFQDRSGTGGYILFPSGAQVLLDYMQQRAIGLADEYIYSCRALKSYQIEPAALLQSDKCDMYGVASPDNHYSVIGRVQNNVQSQDSSLNTLKFKLRRIQGQLSLGVYFLKFIMLGTRRYIRVDKEKF